MFLTAYGYSCVKQRYNFWKTPDKEERGLKISFGIDCKLPYNKWPVNVHDCTGSTYCNIWEREEGAGAGGSTTYSPGLDDAQMRNDSHIFKISRWPKLWFLNTFSHESVFRIERSLPQILPHIFLFDIFSYNQKTRHQKKEKKVPSNKYPWGKKLVRCLSFYWNLILLGLLRAMQIYSTTKCPR